VTTPPRRGSRDVIATALAPVTGSKIAHYSRSAMVRTVVQQCVDLDLRRKYIEMCRGLVRESV